MTNAKCPKCGSRTFQLVSTCKVDYLYDVIEGHVYGNGQGSQCDELSNLCECEKCGHKWHPRNFDCNVDN